MVLEAESDKIPFFKQYFSVIILAANIIVFIWQILDPAMQMHIEYAFVPAEFFAGQKLWTILTSMFMHGDIVHIIMNMWFFIIITDNCEHALGHFYYLITYLVAGICGTLLHALSALLLIDLYPILVDIPSLGASGAIFGVMFIAGAIAGWEQVPVILIPILNIITLPFIFFTFKNIKVPLFVAILFYLILELIMLFMNLPMSIGEIAHFGGFLGGIMGTLLIIPKK